MIMGWVNKEYFRWLCVFRVAYQTSQEGQRGKTGSEPPRTEQNREEKEAEHEAGSDKKLPSMSDAAAILPLGQFPTYQLFVPTDGDPIAIHSTYTATTQRYSTS